jgi:hypothetical protein
MWRVVYAAREQEIVGLQRRQLDPFLHRVTGTRRDLELHWALSLVLHHHGAGCSLIPVADVPDLQADEVAAAKLAVDAQVE